MAAGANLDTDVLIVGAGPTGLVLALWLTRFGVGVRIIDKTLEPGTTSRALAVQARTLELYGQMRLSDAVIERSRKALAVNLWVAGKRKAHVVFGDMGAEISPYLYPVIFPQDEHERLLIDRLEQAGIAVERATELIGFESTAENVVARLRRPDGAVETCQSHYIAGCDGARSAVREALKIGFAGGTYEHIFYVADVEATGSAVNGELHVGLDKTDFLALFPLKDNGRVRLVGTVRDAAQEHETLSWDDISKRVIDWMPLNVARVNWFSTYHVHHRVAEHFRKGRAFLLGDAAHIHSPVGGQGMNTGIGDAVNLAWKLAWVLKRRAHYSLLETYEPERMAFARRLVETTDRAFTAVTSSGPIARFLRLRLVPAVLPSLFASRAMRRLLYRTVSQTDVNYRMSALSGSHWGALQGGDRLPWVRTSPGPDNFAPLTSLDWQVHVYGVANEELGTVCTRRKLPLHVFPWQPEMARTGLRRDGIYLVRPDGYLAIVDTPGSAAAVTSYLDTHHIEPMPIQESMLNTGQDGL
jgi:2-polyprenyl-6-methoxyphenol hydroxylase-like FAD-dependent oxidoreductase